jgi:Uma2 family endonuclease
LEVEDASEVRHEFHNGHIYAMAGGTPEHAALCAAIPGLLSQRLLGGPCRMYSSDLRLATGDGLYTYPDAAIICGPPQRAAESATHITNPTVLFEVLSPSTEAYDRGDKLHHYQQMPSVTHVVLVAQSERNVEVWQRTSEGWVTSAHDSGNVSVGHASFDVDALYDLAGVDRR